MNEIKLSPDLLKTKPHFSILDGLRGIAALAVVIFHFMEWVFADSGKNFIGHGFLAVDFFFCLSGFVMGYAYDNRIRKMAVGGFFKCSLCFRLEMNDPPTDVGGISRTVVLGCRSQLKHPPTNVGWY